MGARRVACFRSHHHLTTPDLKTPKRPTLLISVGEISADIFAADLVREIHRLRPDIRVIGMGSTRLREAGAEIIVDVTAHSTVGLMEIVEHLPALVGAWRRMKRLLSEARPDLVLLVDYQGFNMMLAKEAKKRGLRTAYYIAPQEWLWGTQKGVENVVATVDHIISVFQEEADTYRKNGGQVLYVGHPLLDRISPTLTTGEARRRLGLPENTFPLIGLFPGSRKQEVTKLLPLLIQSAQKIHEQDPAARFVMSCVGPLYSERIRRALASPQLAQEFSASITLVEGKSDLVLRSVDLALLSSGTITLEAALTQTPMVVIYKLSPITEWIALNILKISVDHIALPNIIGKKRIVPELTQKMATPELICAAARDLLAHPEKLKRIREELGTVRRQMGEAPVTPRIARMLAPII